MHGASHGAKKPLFTKLFYSKLVSLLLIGAFSFGTPALAEASLLSMLGLENTASAETIPTSSSLNSQNMALPQATVAQKGAGEESVDLTISDDALIAQTGPLGTQADVADEPIPERSEIYTYIVRGGDTLPVVAKMLGVSVGTIVWANDLSGKNAKLTPGQVLAILPTSGISYTIKKGDTVGGIAKKFKVDADEIGKFNGLELDSKLIAGEEIIIPGAELALPSSSSTSSSSGSTSGSSKLPLYAYGATRYIPGHDGPDVGGYYIRPVRGCIRTQALHGANGVDIGCPKGTPILAAASGTVLIAREGGWNGGFGNYIVINHPNGTQTLYGHLSKVSVAPGQVVSQGETIGLMGSTGRSTGSHLHFEVHGAGNPLGKDARYGL